MKKSEEDNTSEDGNIIVQATVPPLQLIAADTNTKNTSTIVHMKKKQLQ